MKLSLATITVRARSKLAAIEELASTFVDRAARYTSVQSVALGSEASLLAAASPDVGRTPVHLILLDPRGKMLSSDDFAAYLGRQRDAGTQQIMLAVGPADGWTDAARSRADLVLSLGPMTLPHELARVVLAEQVYRALTILAGHPYHTGH